MGSIDWQEASKGGDYTVYPTGTYLVSITGYEQVTASTGTPQIRWRGTIIEPAEYTNKPITIHTALTEKSLWRVGRLVKGCGIDTSSLPKMEIGSPSFMQVLDACVRRTTYWHLIVKADDKGRDRNDVDDFRIDENQEICSVDNVDNQDLPDFLKRVQE